MGLLWLVTSAVGSSNSEQFFPPAEGSPQVARTKQRKHYLHLSVFQCSDCSGPVVSGSIAVRENEISKETEVSEVGAICLSCGHRQINASDGSLACNFPHRFCDPTQPIAARPY